MLLEYDAWLLDCPTGSLSYAVGYGSQLDEYNQYAIGVEIIIEKGSTSLAEEVFEHIWRLVVVSFY